MRASRSLACWSVACAFVVCFAMWGPGVLAAGPLDRESIEFPVIEVEPAPPRVDYMEGEVLVRPRIEPFPPGTRVEEASRAVETLTRGLGARTVETIMLATGVPVYRVELEPSRGIFVEEAVAYYERDPAIEYAEPNWKRYAYQVEEDAPIDDPYFVYMWGLHNTGQEIIPGTGIAGIPDADIDAPEAWEVFDSSEPVVVAVIDTGIQYYHPDLADNMWRNPGEIPDNGQDDDQNGFIDDVYGWDFFSNDNTVYDVEHEESHGTHTAGTIAAVGDNGLGVAGVAWKANVRIMALKFLGPDGGSDADALKAFSYAAQMGATITSNSWGGGGYGKALREAIEASGMLAMCSAGNSATDNDAVPHYPSSYVSENIISVAASDWNDELAGFSCWGEQSVDIAAPGHWVLSTYPARDYIGSSYAWAGGTSMATPHVSGVAALLVAAHPEMPQYVGDDGWVEGVVTVKDMILNSSEVRPAFAGKVLTGGRLNAYNALMGIWPPAIHEVNADRTYGEPGALTVAFSASAGERLGVRDAAPITDQWWDFGDGSEPVHATTATHTYVDEGLYVATFHAKDALGNEAIARVEIVAANPDTVLFVDDDEGMTYDGFFTSALTALEEPFIVVTPSVVTGLPADIPNPIIWNCGEAFSGTLMAGDQEYLSQYLDNGGRLFVSGYDILYDLLGERNGLDFVQTYLHVDTSSNGLGLLDYWYGVGVGRVTGKAGDLISDGMDIGLEYPGTYDPGYVDGIIPTDGAVGIFEVPPASQGDPPITVGLRYADSRYRVVFLGFPFESVPEAAAPPNDSPTLMQRILGFLASEEIGENLLPAIDGVLADVQVGVAPLEVSFSATAHDAEGDVTCEWDFGDETTTVEGTSADHVFESPGVYTVTFTATDSDEASVSKSLTVVVLDGPETVLLVDGDSVGTTPSYVEPVLQQAAVPYQYVVADDITADDTFIPGTEHFVMFWNCGLSDYPTPDQTSAMKHYLKSGGRLFIAGQELIYGVGMNFSNPDDFVIKYLHVGDANSDVQSEPGEVFTGIEGDPITDGLSFAVDFEAAGLPAGVNWIDEIHPDSEAVGILTAPDDTYRALRYDGNGYKVVFLAFPFEVIPVELQAPAGSSRNGSASAAETLVSRAYEWLLMNEIPVVTVSVPENAVCAAGRRIDIRWTAADPDGLDCELAIDIDYSMDSGTTWTVVADGEPNDGLYSWDGAGIERGGRAVIRVSATDPRGATGSATDEVTLVSGPNMLLAGPNPASTHVTLYYNIPEAGTVFVYDIAGRLVYSTDLAAGSGASVWSLVDSSGRDLANGLYIAILVTDSGLKSDPVRLIVRRQDVVH